MAEYLIELEGFVPSKKNTYSVSYKTRKFYKDTELVNQLARLDSQIPSNIRGLELVHPDIHFYLTVDSRRGDRDNKCQTLLDLLVKAKVIKNDNIASLNGHIHIWPAKVEKLKNKTTIHIISKA